MIQTNRRQFLKQAAMAAAAGALTGTLPTDFNGLAEGADSLTWAKAPCRFCGTGCGVMVGVKNGRVVAVQGDLENPVNKGLRCAKGYQ